MSEETIANYCAPTLAGLKTANLFGCRCSSPLQARSLVRKWNDDLNSKGVFAQILQYKDNRALIYVYRRVKLQRILSEERVQYFLQALGYEEMEMSSLIRRLGARIRSTGDFPHEIGIFLGYPFNDVLSFIKNQGKNYRDVHFWKVYDNVEEARKTCSRYRKCTEVYRQKIREGFSVQKLTVAGRCLQEGV